MMKKCFAIMLALSLLLCALPVHAQQEHRPYASFEIRQKSSTDAARIMRIGREYFRTSVNYISLENPISIRMVDASPSGKGMAVEIAYTTSNKGSKTQQYLLGCEGLQLTSKYWPQVTVDGTYALALIINGGTVDSMRIDGGEITFDGVTITGVIELRGETTTANFVDCTFGEGALIRTSETVTLLKDGVPLE